MLATRDHGLHATRKARSASRTRARADATWHSTVAADDQAGPSVLRTPLPDGQPTGVTLAVTATITDPSGLQAVVGPSWPASPTPTASSTP